MGEACSYPDILRLEFFEAWDPRPLDHSPRAAFHPESFFIAPGPADGPRGRKTARKTPVALFLSTTRGGLGPGSNVDPRTHPGVRMGQNLVATADLRTFMFMAFVLRRDTESPVTADNSWQQCGLRCRRSSPGVAGCSGLLAAANRRQQSGLRCCRVFPVIPCSPPNHDSPPRARAAGGAPPRPPARRRRFAAFGPPRGRFRAPGGPLTPDPPCVGRSRR